MSDTIKTADETTGERRALPLMPPLPPPSTLPSYPWGADQGTPPPLPALIRPAGARAGEEQPERKTLPAWTPPAPLPPLPTMSGGAFEAARESGRSLPPLVTPAAAEVRALPPFPANAASPPQALPTFPWSATGDGHERSLPTLAVGSSRVGDALPTGGFRSPDTAGGGEVPGLLKDILTALRGLRPAVQQSESRAVNGPRVK